MPRLRCQSQKIDILHAFCENLCDEFCSNFRFSFLEDKRKIQLENKDKSRKELDRMQREKTAQNGNVFARQQAAMEDKHTKEVHQAQTSVQNPWIAFFELINQNKN